MTLSVGSSTNLSFKIADLTHTRHPSLGDTLQHFARESLNRSFFSLSELVGRKAGFVPGVHPSCHGGNIFKSHIHQKFCPSCAIWAHWAGCNNLARSILKSGITPVNSGMSALGHKRTSTRTLVRVTTQNFLFAAPNIRALRRPTRALARLRLDDHVRSCRQWLALP